MIRDKLTGKLPSLFDRGIYNTPLLSGVISVYNGISYSDFPKITSDGSIICGSTRLALYKNDNTSLIVTNLQVGTDYTTFSYESFYNPEVGILMIKHKYNYNYIFAYIDVNTKSLATNGYQFTTNIYHNPQPFMCGDKIVSFNINNNSSVYNQLKDSNLKVNPLYLNPINNSDMFRKSNGKYLVGYKMCIDPLTGIGRGFDGGATYNNSSAELIATTTTYTVSFFNNLTGASSTPFAQTALSEVNYSEIAFDNKNDTVFQLDKLSVVSKPFSANIYMTKYDKVNQTYSDTNTFAFKIRAVSHNGTYFTGVIYKPGDHNFISKYHSEQIVVTITRQSSPPEVDYFFITPDDLYTGRTIYGQYSDLFIDIHKYMYNPPAPVDSYRIPDTSDKVIESSQMYSVSATSEYAELSSGTLTLTTDTTSALVTHNATIIER